MVALGMVDPGRLVTTKVEKMIGKAKAKARKVIKERSDG